MKRGWLVLGAVALSVPLLSFGQSPASAGHKGERSRATSGSESNWKTPYLNLIKIMNLAKSSGMPVFIDIQTQGSTASEPLKSKAVKKDVTGLVGEGTQVIQNMLDYREKMANDPSCREPSSVALMAVLDGFVGVLNQSVKKKRLPLSKMIQHTKVVSDYLSDKRKRDDYVTNSPMDSKDKALKQGMISLLGKIDNQIDLGEPLPADIRGPVKALESVREGIKDEKLLCLSGKAETIDVALKRNDPDSADAAAGADQGDFDPDEVVDLGPAEDLDTLKRELQKEVDNNARTQNIDPNELSRIQQLEEELLTAEEELARIRDESRFSNVNPRLDQLGQDRLDDIDRLLDNRLRRFDRNRGNRNNGFDPRLLQALQANQRRGGGGGGFAPPPPAFGFPPIQIPRVDLARSRNESDLPPFGLNPFGPFGGPLGGPFGPGFQPPFPPLPFPAVPPIGVAGGVAEVAIGSIPSLISSGIQSGLQNVGATVRPSRAERLSGLGLGIGTPGFGIGNPVGFPGGFVPACGFPGGPPCLPQTAGPGVQNFSPLRNRPTVVNVDLAGTGAANGAASRQFVGGGLPTSAFVGATSNGAAPVVGGASAISQSFSNFVNGRAVGGGAPVNAAGGVLPQRLLNR